MNYFANETRRAEAHAAIIAKASPMMGETTINNGTTTPWKGDVPFIGHNSCGCPGHCSMWGASQYISGSTIRVRLTGGYDSDTAQDCAVIATLEAMGLPGFEAEVAAVKADREEYYQAEREHYESQPTVEREPRRTRTRG